MEGENEGIVFIPIYSTAIVIMFFQVSVDPEALEEYIAAPDDCAQESSDVIFCIPEALEEYFADCADCPQESTDVIVGIPEALEEYFYAPDDCPHEFQ